MEALGATSAAVGLAIPLFKCAKELRDKIKLVRPLSSKSSAYLQSAYDYSMFYIHVSQVASEKAELLAALIEYEKDINLLESLYNNNKALLDQHELDTDLKELAEYE